MGLHKILRARGWVALVAIGMAMAVMAAAAQTMYRWKDNQGVLHITDQPPPQNCTSADCQEHRQRVDQKLETDRRAREAKVKADAATAKEKENARVLDELKTNVLILQIKKTLLTCQLEYSSACAPDQVRSSLKVLAYKEGQPGIVKVLDQPYHRQDLDGGRMYWYYKWNGSTMQLVWRKLQDYTIVLDDVNFH